MFTRLFGSLLSSYGRSARMVILMYHRVLPAPDPFLPDDLDVARFDQQMRSLARNFTPLALPEAVRRLREGRLPARTVVVTFDDGYRDNYEVALPVLHRHGIPATFFVASSFLDGGRMWNDTIIEVARRHQGETLDLSALDLGVHATADQGDRLKMFGTLIGRLKYEQQGRRQDLVDAIAAASGEPLPDDLMMDSGQVRSMADSGMDIGAHTDSHPILSRLATEDAEADIVAGRDRLQDIIGRPVSTFAYPNGRPGEDYKREHVDMLKAHGFDIAVSTSWACATMASDCLQLPRIAPWDKTIPRYNLRLLRAYRETAAASV